MFGTVLVDLPMHSGRPVVINMHPVKPEIALVRLRVFGDHERERDELASVLGPALDKRKFVEHSTFARENDLLLARSENDGRKEAVKDLLKIHDTVSLYFAVMGKLAGDDTFSLKVNLDALTRQIKVSELTDLEKKQVEAYGKLAGIVSSTILSGYQQQEIARYIGHGNDPVQAMLAGMRQVLKVYLGTLRNEEGRFGYLLLFKRETPQDRILAALAGAEQARLVERADETRKKLIAVDLAIVKIAQGHQELYNSRHDLGNRELMEQLESLVKELNSLNDLLDTVRG